MKGHLARGQRPKEISYIKFWATCDTNTKVWNLKAGEFLQQLKYPIPRRWNLGVVGTFIKGVKYQVDGTLTREREHLFQALRQNVVIRLSRTIAVLGMKM